jgi:hypothetical protein
MIDAQTPLGPAAERLPWHKLYASASRSSDGIKAEKAQQQQTATLAARRVEADDGLLAQHQHQQPPIGCQRTAATRRAVLASRPWRSSPLRAT